MLRKELDYVLEAHNAEIFRANFADVPGVYIPAPYADLTTKRVLIMERIGGIKISDTAALDRAGIDRSELAHRFYRAYLKQWFLDGIFHADPHPGNLFVRVDGPPATPPVAGNRQSTAMKTEDERSRMEEGRPSSILHPPSSNPEQATTPVAGDRLNGDAQAGGPRPGTPCTLIFIDFGMVERISSRIMEALHENTIAVATNDPERFVESLDRAGMILPGADRRQLILAAQILFRHTYDRSIREMTNIDVEEVFQEVEGLVRDLPFQMPQDLIYLGRSVGMVTGMTTTLDRDMNLFETLRPFAQEMMAREQREGSLVDRLRQEVTTLGQIAITLPRQMDAFYKAANRGDLQMRVDLGRLERGMRRVERATNRLAGGIIATGLFIGGVLLRINGFADETTWAWAAAALVTLWTLWPRGDR